MTDIPSSYKVTSIGFLAARIVPSRYMDNKPKTTKKVAVKVTKNLFFFMYNKTFTAKNLRLQKFSENIIPELM